MARILIIEDDPANLKLASMLLRKAAHTVLGAVDAESGLTLARTQHPDLILMDIQLPGMDGLEATAVLKHDPATANIPVIALTANAMKADPKISLEAGCDGYLSKPLRYRELYGAIDHLLVKPGAQEESDAHPQVPPLPGKREAFEPPSRDEALRNGRMILVAEDNELNQELIVLQLGMLGFAADAVDDGRLALELWRSGHYALLLSDLQMPRMDGYELTAAIRSQERGARRIPIVALSASASEAEADHCRTTGMDDYLGKPMSLAQLKATLERWLPGAASAVQPRRQEVPDAHAAGAVDVSVLEGYIGNEPAVVREFLQDFRTGAATMTLKLKMACAERDSVQAGEQAHKLMSSARAVGALRLGELCAQMAAAGKAGDAETQSALCPLIEQEFDVVKTRLDSLLA